MTTTLIVSLCGMLWAGQPGVGGGGGKSSPLPETTSHVLIDRQLRTRTVRLVSVEPQGVKVIESGQEQTLPMTDVLGLADAVSWNAIVDAHDRSAADRAGLGLLELVDGQRVVGGFAPADPGRPEDHLAWEAGPLGTLVIKLDRVARVREGAMVAAPPPRADRAKRDRVVLSNGDVLEGFVERLGAEVWVAVGTSGPATRVEASRIREVTLTNPLEPLTGRVLWLGAGSIIGVEALAPARAGTLAFSARAEVGSDRSIEVRLDQIRAFLPDAASLRPLSELPIARQEPAADRTGAAPVRVLGRGDAPLNAADIELPGPMTVEWTLPENAARLAATVTLPVTARDWGDCEVIVEAVDAAGQGKPLERQRLNADSPTFALNVPVAGAARVRVRVEAGAYGPIQDRVLLRRPVVGG